MAIAVRTAIWLSLSSFDNFQRLLSLIVRTFDDSHIWIIPQHQNICSNLLENNFESHARIRLVDWMKITRNYVVENNGMRVRIEGSYCLGSFAWFSSYFFSSIEAQIRFLVEWTAPKYLTCLWIRNFTWSMWWILADAHDLWRWWDWSVTRPE